MKSYINHLKSVAAEQVHLNGVESFEKLPDSHKDGLIDEFKSVLNRLISLEHKKQYGKYPRRNS